MSASGQQPTSFKTNVNRAKTKRWVEAKSYTYDGDDWGDADEYDEYGGYDEPPTPPKPTGLRQQGQSAGSISQSPYGSPTAPQQRWNENARADYGNIAPQQQQKYGLRSSTNPQPRVNQDLGRSASFDRGDEKRAFSAGGSQTGIRNSGAPTNQKPYNTPNVQSPTQFNPNQMRQVQPDLREAQPQRQMPQQRDQFIAEAGNAYSPSANYRGPYSYDEPRHAAAGNRTQSMTSTTSSIDVHNRRDFTPSALPPPLHPQSSPPLVSGPVPQRPPRSSSLSQTTQPQIYNSAQGPSTEALSEASSLQRERTSSNAGKPLPLIRPADIYRRMNEEKERQRQSQESPRPSIDAVTNIAEDQKLTSHTNLREEELRFPGPATSAMSTSPLESTEADVHKQELVQSSHPGTRIQGERGTSEDLRSDQFTRSYQQQTSSPATASTKNQNSLLPMLPEVARMSAFGDSFLATSNQDDRAESETIVPPASHQPPIGPTTMADGSITDLQHQPSSGFRSVVNQAFDITDDQIPPTPSTTAGSGVERSTSGGTSVISPIISRGPSTSKPESNLKDAAKPPLTSPVAEEVESSSSIPMPSEPAGKPRQTVKIPVESDAAPADYHEPSPVHFIPGHRRDLSTPSPGNSPARTPAVESNRQLRQPQEAELAIASPTEPDAGSRMSPTKEAGPVRGESPFSFDLRNRNDASNQSKVRDLAGKFESASSSRRGSDQSPTRRIGQLALASQNKDSAAPTRPQGDRMESFRPRLPGGWDSYASNALLATSNKSLEEERRGSDNGLDDVNAFPQRLDDTGASSSLESPDTPTQAHHTEGRPESQNDPFSSVKAAGSALAGAFASITGVDQSASDESAGTETSAARFVSNEPISQPRSRSTSINTTIHPEADRPPLPLASDDDDDDDLSSVAPTPPLKKSQMLKKMRGSPEHFQQAATPGNSEYAYGSQQATSVSRPPMPPQLSTDAGSHYESDRLRREIMRDLTPDVPSEPTTAESESPYQDEPRLPAVQTSQPNSAARESIVLPKEYESYWNGPSRQSLSRSSSGHNRTSASIGLQEVPATAMVNEDPSTLSANDPQVDLASTKEGLLGIRPSLEPHRFSWESPSPRQLPTMETSQKPLPNSPPLQTSYSQEYEPIQSKNADNEGLEVSQRELPDSPTVHDPFGKIPVDAGSREFGSLQADGMSHKPTLPETFRDRGVSGFSSEKQSTPDSTETGDSLRGRTHAEAFPQSETEGPYEHPPSASSTIPKNDELISSIPTPPVQTGVQPKVPAFREILALKTAAERIRSFNEARDHFANTESELRNWLTTMSNARPEHSDVLANVGRPPAAIMDHKPSTSRLLSGLRSTGSQQPSVRPGISALDTGNSFSQGSSPLAGGSKISSHQVQAKGKDLLHSAGVFGGKANVAAKGLFSKGRSRLKEARGSDKDTPPSSPVSMPPEMQPQNQPPLVQSTRNVSFDTSTFASEQPDYYRNQNQNHFEPVQQASDYTTLDVVGGSLGDGQVEHGLRHTRDDQKDHPAIPSNLQSPIIHAPSSQVHGPVVRDESGHGRDLASPSGKFPTKDSGAEGPLQSQIIQPNSMGREISIQSGPSKSNGTSVPGISQEHTNKKSLENQRSARENSSKEDVDSSAKENLPWRTVPSTPHSRSDPLQGNTNDTTIRLSHEKSLSQPTKTERTSEDSNGTFHTAENAVRSRPDSAMVEESPETPKAKQPQPPSFGDPVLFNGENSAFTPIVPPTTDEPTVLVQDEAEEQGNEPSADYLARPENDPYKPSSTTLDYLAREPSLDNIVSQIESDRSPSPVSPQHSIHNVPVRQQSTREPIYYGPQHDFDVKQTRDSALRHPRYSSQPGEFSGLSERPAFPLPSHNENQASKRIDANVHIERAAGSYVEEKASPAISSSDRKSRSNRTSRNSVFFKNFGGSGTVGVPSIVSAVETQQQSPSTNMTIANESEKKFKRGSLFRSRPSDKSDDDTRGIASPSTTESAVPIDTWRQASPSTSKSSQLDGSLESDPTKLRNKLNRASTSGNKVIEEGGKKKRFSAIGSLFGKRSSRNQPSPAIQARYMQGGLSDNSATPQQPQYQAPHSSHLSSVDQPRQQPESRLGQGQVDSPGSYRAYNSSPSRSNTIGSQTSTPAWSQTAQRVSQPRQSSYKEPSAYVQDSSLRQRATSPSIAISPGPVRNSTSVSQKTPSDTPITKPRTSLFSRSKSRESSTTGKNKESPGKSWITSRDRDRQDRPDGSSSRQSLPVQEPQRVLTFSQFGESHIASNLDQQQQPSQNQSSDRQSHSPLNPQPQRTTSLGNNPPSRGPPRVLTFNQFGENHIVESPPQRQLVQSSPQNKATQVQQPTVVTFQQFPSTPKPLPSQISGRESPPPPPPPPKDDWHVSKSRGSPSQSIQANDRQQHAGTISSTSAPKAPSYPDPRRTSQPQPQAQAQAQQRQAPPPIQTEIPSARLSAFSPASNSAESRKARQRELESVAPSTEKEMTSVPAKSDTGSEERIVMSSSSYPGQEWQPSFAYDD